MRMLSVALADRPHVRALLRGKRAVDGYVLRPVSVQPIIGAYRRMVRELAFDVCELAPVTYLMAIAAGCPLTAIPVFLDRRFHHGDIQCGPGSGIREPADLAGRRVGVRAYTVTTGVWVRGILDEDHGVAPSEITWVVDDEDHVPFRVPGNVERVSDGRSLAMLLGRGEIDAALTGNAGTGRVGTPRPGWSSPAPPASTRVAPYPLFDDADQRALDWHRRTGIYPLHSVVAIRSQLVRDDPELATALYRLFVQSKRAHLAADPRWRALPRIRRQAKMIAGDPLPYGRAGNAPTLAALQRFCRAQGLLEAVAAQPFADGDYPDG